MATSTIGPGKDYTTWADFASAVSGNSSDETAVLDVAQSYGDVTITNLLAATYKLTIQAGASVKMQAHADWATDQYSAMTNSARFGFVAVAGTDIVEFRDVVFVGGGSVGLHCRTAANTVTAFGCGVATAGAGGFRCNNSGASLTIEQCFATNATHSSLGAGFMCSNGTMTVIYSDSIRNVFGFKRSGGTMTVRACRSITNSNSDFNGTTNETYSLSTDATATGTGSTASLTATNVIVDDTDSAFDLHWASGNDGTYDSAAAGTESSDIEGTARVDWDAGCFEVVGGGGGATVARPKVGASLGDRSVLLGGLVR